MENLKTYSLEKKRALQELNEKLLNKNESPTKNIIFVYVLPIRKIIRSGN